MHISKKCQKEQPDAGPSRCERLGPGHLSDLVSSVRILVYESERNTPTHSSKPKKRCRKEQPDTGPSRCERLGPGHLSEFSSLIHVLVYESERNTQTQTYRKGIHRHQKKKCRKEQPDTGPSRCERLGPGHLSEFISLIHVLVYESERNTQTQTYRKGIHRHKKKCRKEQPDAGPSRCERLGPGHLSDFISLIDVLVYESERNTQTPKKSAERNSQMQVPLDVRGWVLGTHLILSY